ncbi:2Fe-2S iron-sulfur cluster binding domain-containing protein [Limnohabitans sp.]|jgi:ferredoxin|uniref:2Fe-2S iron-sulfur cluster-binding protein n=1 Tax=Limnohabitans sp. TaxID=1907725 RepID=UPI001B428ABA|nr:2Fe-2S iron-sulfur cluster binding domain-containing protein [Limnohabitans sp.]MBP6219917.1 2Fe-2S iron-sulfur cluster binding domain-containing protein [Limnohabitans sp.]MBP6244442.1 2Fe-2S iron-sulfur cluster binding domain-containing protein [Limnohabitans sp.]
MNTTDLTQSPLTDDGSFEVQLEKSGQILRVTKDQSILKVLQDAGHDVPFSCSEGICGTCLTKVVAGTPDHWDMFLTPEEQEANDQMLICCSRSQTARLVLDL